ncbi:MAG: family 20 glycosylhydrolase, partial [Betaproteobacteria bacterium]|nr:family 20 glycosylhydrolase [Betaproteobacteria bacterium]
MMRTWMAAMFSSAAIFAVQAQTQAQPAIIPNPVSIQPQAGEFQLSRATPIVVAKGDKEALRAAQQLRDLIGRTYGAQLPLVQGTAKGAAIELLRDARSGFGAEGYQLQVAPARITLRAATGNGLFYAGVSLWQMLGKVQGKDFTPIPAVLIIDAPRFGWRGMMLDSARHFQSPTYIRHFIDWMAVHKMNTLHWHLTDDQAWRLEIKKYPRLTEVAAWRVPAGAAPLADIDPATGKPRLYGGFYTQETVRDLVRYAAARAITIVPEIEIPGHATATLAAYPQLASITN